MGKTQGGVFNWNINNFYVVETATGAVAPDEINSSEYQLRCKSRFRWQRAGLVSI